MSSTPVDSAELSGPDAAAIPAWLGRVGRVSWVIAVPAIAALVIRELLAGKLGGAAVDLSHASLPWAAGAAGVEVLSYLLYAAAQRCLLRRGDRRLTIRWLASLAVCAQGVSNFVPAGYLAANVLNFREFHRRGLSPPSCAWLLVASSGLYIGALALLTAIAGEIAGGRANGGVAGVRIGAWVVLAALPVAAFAIRWLLRHGILRVPPAWRVSEDRRRMSASVAATAALLFSASWLADAGCLVAAIQAVGAHPVWALVPIAYCAAQLVSFLPVTPGGLGLVEGSLTVTLVAGGGGSAVLAAVLLYRMISYWGTLPFGLLGYLAVRRARVWGSTSSDADDATAAARGHRAPGDDRPLLVLEG